MSPGSQDFKSGESSASGAPGRSFLFKAAVQFDRDICGALQTCEQREWLVTNGIGGFASGTLSGVLTRRYHGLLVAALKPPLGRTLLVAKLSETAQYLGQSYPLDTTRWRGGELDPQGFRQLDSFRLEGTTPVWTFACGEARIEKRVWMQPDANTTYVRYDLASGGPLELQIKALVNYRDFHGSTHAGDWRMSVAPVEHGLRIVAFDGAAPFHVLSSGASATPAHDWYRNFDLQVERSRGLDDHEDHLHAGTFRARLVSGAHLTLVLSTDTEPELDGRAAWQARLTYEQSLLDRWVARHPLLSSEAPAWLRQLVFAADQFIVRRASPEDPDGRSVIAGYHWFGDWGRDTMIALPGLTLATGRPELARKILLTFAHYMDRGMLPNSFPEAGQTPEYNTVDAALWFIEAVRQAFTSGGAATRDTALVRELFPVLEDIIDWHVRGTRYSIRVDREDGLLAAGEPGVQLTWMDAKVGDRVVTPRIGKPVEVNALWYNALAAMALFARVLGKPDANYESMAIRAQRSFQRFWNRTAGYCFDVIDAPGVDGTKVNDASLRPNQLLAVSLPVSPLDPQQQRAVVDICARELLTPYGLRSLAQNDPQYRGHYGGSPAERDASYHQGTVWGWLLGPFVLAHLKVYDRPEQAGAWLETMAWQMQAYGLGTLGEIFDGDPPFLPRGCIAQAWTVAEVLRAWQASHAHHRASAAAR